jgi:hypothetical protein
VKSRQELLLAALTGGDAEKEIGRAPADDAGKQRYDSQISPRGAVKDQGDGDDSQTSDDPYDTINTTNIAFHDDSPFMSHPFAMDTIPPLPERREKSQNY